MIRGIFYENHTSIKRHFSKPGAEQPGQSGSAQFDPDAYIVNHLLAIEKEAVRFIERYGLDFKAFFYRPDLGVFIRGEILTFRDPEPKHNYFIDTDHWRQKNPSTFRDHFIRANQTPAEQVTLQLLIMFCLTGTLVNTYLSNPYLIANFYV